MLRLRASILPASYNFRLLKLNPIHISIFVVALDSSVFIVLHTQALELAPLIYQFQFQSLLRVFKMAPLIYVMRCIKAY